MVSSVSSVWRILDVSSVLLLSIGGRILLFLSLSGCALFRENSGPPESFAPREQTYYANFDQVWRAAQLSLQNYPLRVNNMDLGVIETEAVKGTRVWSPPHKPDTNQAGLSYSLGVRLIKGRSEGREAVKVTILKESEQTHDFFSEPHRIPSDGLEEKSILYRIGRELQIEKALEAAHKKNDQKTSSDPDFN